MPSYIDKHPISNTFEFFAPAAEETRSCPYCHFALFQVNEIIAKCLHCGFTRTSRQSLSAQHHYDLNRAALQKKAYPSFELMPEENEYNVLVWAGWAPEEAYDEVVADMNLTGTRLDYFKTKVEYVKEERAMLSNRKVLSTDTRLKARADRLERMIEEVKKDLRLAVTEGREQDEAEHREELKLLRDLYYKMETQEEKAMLSNRGVKKADLQVEITNDEEAAREVNSIMGALERIPRLSRADALRELLDIRNSFDSLIQYYRRAG